MSRIRFRLIAVGFLCYFIGLVVSLKKLPIEMPILEYTTWDKIEVIFIFAVTMWIGYAAGKEVK